MKQSETLKELGTALAKAQGALTHASKSSVNPYFKSKYADLASVWEACREQLSSNGLSVVQAPAEFQNNIMTLTTRLLHSSGEWLEQTMTCPIPDKKLDPQGIGSSITYMRRYALAAIVGIYQDDDDANSASYAPKEHPATLTDEEITRIKTLAVATHSDNAKIAAFYGKKDLHEIERLHFPKIVEALEKKLKKEGE
jgi:hypothetical protein